MVKGCSHDDRVDASTPDHPRLPRQFYFIFPCSLRSQGNMKKCLLRLVFPSDSGI